MNILITQTILIQVKLYLRLILHFFTLFLYLIGSSSSNNTNSASSQVGPLVGRRSTFSWNSVAPHSATFRSSSHLHFRPGLSFAVREISSQLDFFFYLVNVNLRSKILEFTNKRLRSSAEPISDDELCGFIVILLLFGVSKKRMLNSTKCGLTIQFIFQNWRQSQCHAQGSKKS